MHTIIIFLDNNIFFIQHLEVGKQTPQCVAVNIGLPQCLETVLKCQSIAQLSISVFQLTIHVCFCFHFFSFRSRYCTIGKSYMGIPVHLSTKPTLGGQEVLLNQQLIQQIQYLVNMSEILGKNLFSPKLLNPPFSLVVP